MSKTPVGLSRSRSPHFPLTIHLARHTQPILILYIYPFILILFLLCHLLNLLVLTISYADMLSKGSIWGPSGLLIYIV